MIYFTFTSLSTVGFGDYAPRSNPERFLFCFVLLFGVAIFSYVMGNFIDIIHEMQALSATFDDGDNLSKFFGLIKNFNHDRDMEPKLARQIEEYFEYKWEYDRNMAVTTDEDKKMLEQLPYEVQVRLFTDFLFQRFLNKYRKYFNFPNLTSKQKHSYYSWLNFDYQNFMIFFLKLLEPIKLD